MADNDQTTLRVQGSEATCRRVLRLLSGAVHVTDVRGPFPNRRDRDVRFYATLTPRRFQSEPGA